MDSSELKNSRNGKFYMPARYVVAIMGFTGICLQYCLKSVLSVAIVAMSKPSDRKNKFMIFVEGPVHFMQLYNDNLNETDVCPGSYDDNNHQEGEFDWNEETQGHILSAYFYGYVCTQLIGGRLGEMIGSKQVFGPGLLLSGIFTVFIPLATKQDFTGLFALRVLTGMASGVVLPSMQSMFGKWFPPEERSKFCSVIYASSHVGSVLAVVLSGLLIEWGGWSLSMYFFGGISIVWYIPWILLIYDSPNQHPRISDKEKHFIESHLGKHAIAPKALPVPWKKILTSTPVWAAALMQVGLAWILYTFITELPTYMKNILHYNVTDSSLLSALPYFVEWISSLFSGWFSQWLRDRGWINLMNSYRLFNGIAAFGPIFCLLGICFSGCNVGVIIVLLAVTLGTNGASYGGSYMNVLDLSPNFAGTLMGLSFTFVNIVGIVTPIITGYLTNEQQTLTQWRKVFYIAIAINLVSYVLYILFGSVELQPWNNPEQDILEDRKEEKKKSKRDKNTDPEKLI